MTPPGWGSDGDLHYPPICHREDEPARPKQNRVDRFNRNIEHLGELQRDGRLSATAWTPCDVVAEEPNDSGLAIESRFRGE